MKVTVIVWVHAVIFRSGIISCVVIISFASSHKNRGNWPKISGGRKGERSYWNWLRNPADREPIAIFYETRRDGTSHFWVCWETVWRRVVGFLQFPPPISSFLPIEAWPQGAQNKEPSFAGPYSSQRVQHTFIEVEQFQLQLRWSAKEHNKWEGRRRMALATRCRCFVSVPKPFVMRTDNRLATSIKVWVMAEAVAPSPVCLPLDMAALFLFSLASHCCLTSQSILHIVKHHRQHQDQECWSLVILAGAPLQILRLTLTKKLHGCKETFIYTLPRIRIVVAPCSSN